MITNPNNTRRATRKIGGKTLTLVLDAKAAAIRPYKREAKTNELRPLEERTFHSSGQATRVFNQFADFGIMPKALS